MGAMGGAGLGMAGGLMGGMLLANAFDDNDCGGYDGGDGGGGDDGGGGEVSTFDDETSAVEIGKGAIADSCPCPCHLPNSTLRSNHPTILRQGRAAFMC